MASGRTLHFNSCIDWLEKAWRLPGDGEGPALLFDLQEVVDRARIAESGLMNAVFMADFYSYNPLLKLEPMTLLSAVAASTHHIGVIGSVSTTYNEPPAVARMIGCLDHLSSGRAGWNMVTTANTPVAANYSRPDHLEHDLRYERAHEFLTIATRLWDEAGTKSADRFSFHGRWFSLDGVPAVMPPPQGHPVRMQAGSSRAGRDFGARWAEVIFTAQPLLELAREFHADINERAAAYGREGAIRILPGLMPFIAPSRDEAQAAATARSQGRGDVAKQLTEFLGVDIATLPPDIPIPLELLPPHGTTNGMRGRADMMLDIVRRYRLTPRQVLAQNAHLIFAGTPAETADLICGWFEERACDGFTLMWPAPESCLLFTTQVVPILQRRGVYRTGYEGPTLRDHFRLARPGARPVRQDPLSS